MRVRKFLLENEKGQQFDMNDYKEGCLFTNPYELGYSHKSEFELLGNTFIEDNRVIEKKDPSGIANFKSYDKYKEFIDFIETSNNLKFLYIIPFQNGDKTYYRDVSIKEIQKTEKKVKRLACPIIFNGLSLWYEENTIIYTIEPQNNEMRWDFRWDSRFLDYNARSLSYINEGHTEAPILVEISGYILNPQIQLYIEGQLYQSVTFNTEIAQYEKFLYGTREDDFYVKRQNADGTEISLFNLDIINFNNDNVIRLPKNKSCELVFSADTQVENAKITILVYYKTI